MSVNNNTTRTIDGQNTLFCDTIEVSEEIVLNGDNGNVNEIIRSDGVNARWATLTSLLTGGTGINITGNTFSTVNVPNSALQHSTISSKALGTNLDTLTINGTEGSITYNGSASATLTINDADTTYTAGTGLSLSVGHEFSTNAIPNASLSNSTISGKALGTTLGDFSVNGSVYDGSSDITITTPDTTYTAGLGLRLIGSEFSTHNIPTGSLAHSTISGKILGNNLDNLTAGNNMVFLNSSTLGVETTYNGSIGITINSADTTYSNGAGLDLTGTTFSTTNSALSDRGVSNIAIGESTLGMGHQEIRIGRGGDHRIIIDSSSTTTIGGDVIEIILDPSGSNKHIKFTNLPISSVGLTTGCIYNNLGTLMIV
tara:strand:+ start:197 stop:1309 length:1113 start_codon:yes stop_codon:yes gene_type:complete